MRKIENKKDWDKFIADFADNWNGMSGRFVASENGYDLDSRFTITTDFCPIRGKVDSSWDWYGFHQNDVANRMEFFAAPLDDIYDDLFCYFGKKAFYIGCARDNYEWL